MVSSELESLSLVETARRTKQAAGKLAVLSIGDRNQALIAIADALNQASPEILKANQKDCQIAEQENISSALLSRLKLGESKLKSAIVGIKDLVNLPDPVGSIQINRELDQGLVLQRVTCPLGVLGIIFEARPEALIQITSLAIKSGNGVILKGGKEAFNSCQALVKIIHQALSKTKVSADAVQLLTSREEIKQLLGLDQYVDLIIPRGSNAFVQFVQDNTRIPVLGHADGICHLYVDSQVDLEQAVEIAVDAKTHYPSACNAIETLLVHQEIAPRFLPALASALTAKQVEIRGDSATQAIISAKEAIEQDWQTEYGELILAIKIVGSLEDAIAHINTYGSRHTEAIATTNDAAAKIFQNQVDAAGVYHNCSTRFADGFRYGFGAEVGISTQQMPPRGPVGLEGLVTYKYKVTGNGHVASTYTGTDAKPFTHRDLS